MLNVEENRLLTQVGAGTPMGEMLRRYWHPVCAVDQVLESPFRTKEVKILGEELVVYLDRLGKLGIVDKYCTHRRASLAYGVVEEDGIRCQYHGWKFDETRSRAVGAQANSHITIHTFLCHSLRREVSRCLPISHSMTG